MACGSNSESMSFKAYIFDLDGTLLDTLPDLVTLTNAVLAERGMPTHSTEEINSYVGGGARVLLARAAPSGTPDSEIESLMARWKELYPQLGHALTKPYPGMSGTLAALKRDGVKLGVLSNKFDAAARTVIGDHFPGVFDMVRGECADYPRKPDPTGLLRMMECFSASPSQVAYIGDSGTDMKVARCAGAVPIGVTWGYRSKDELLENGAEHLIDAPHELLTIR